MAHMHTVRSPNLSKSKLAKAVRLFRSTEIPVILDRFWENIPDDKDYTDEQKLEFVICTYPDIGAQTPEMLHHIIIQEITIGPVLQPTNPRDYEGSKPALWHRVERLSPEMARSLAETMRPHKHVPSHVSDNDMWLGLISLMQFIDGLYVRYQDPLRVNRILIDNDNTLMSELKEYLSKMQDASKTILEG
ncbi:MAG: hypothetical protein HDQ88_08665 [Clostridia bacterium]|nr:hypothetical protein [Clostridia bacterium]